MKLLITSALLVLAISPFAQANHDLSYHNRGEHSSNVFKARVIDSTPIYKYVTVSQPQTYCQPAVVNKTHRYSHDRGAATVGGIVGGVIGHAASDKHSLSYQAQQQTCVVTYKKNSKVRVLDGYTVTYRSKGMIYRTLRQNKPAKYIRINY